MDPTETLIKAINALQDLEREFAIDPKSEATELARTEAVGQLGALSNWLGPLNGFPPELSSIDFDAEAEN